jgi:hypothetical protein
MADERAIRRAQRIAFHNQRQGRAVAAAVRIDELRNNVLAIANSVCQRLGMSPFPMSGTPRNHLVAQVTFALVLLMGAGLLTASFRQVLAIRPGFVPEQVVTGSVGLPAARYRDDAAVRSFTERSLEKIRALPGVLEAGVTDTIPFGSDFNDSVILAEGYTMRPGEFLISGDNPEPRFGGDLRSQDGG